jgi:toxin ParE1/3/4
MTAGEAWRVNIGTAAATDFASILQWTAEQFGTGQARVYDGTLRAALNDLHDGPGIAGVRRRDEIGSDLATLHVARGGRRGRHFILFRVRAGEQPPVVEVLRILHDAMDLARHVPSSESEPR